MTTVEVSSVPRMITVVSNSYACPRCCIICMETKPIFPKGGAARFFAEKGKLPKCKVWCRNGCHQHEKWGWRDINDPIFKGKHIERGLF